jgi:hypothetical protein
MLFREIITVYSKNSIKPVAHFVEKMQLLIVKSGAT